MLHIELRKWADLLVVAPLSANTLSSIVVGRCDGLLLSVLRAWDWGEERGGCGCAGYEYAYVDASGYGWAGGDVEGVGGGGFDAGE